jgi:hypothetical protein
MLRGFWCDVHAWWIRLILIICNFNLLIFLSVFLIELNWTELFNHIYVSSCLQLQTAIYVFFNLLMT